MTAVTLHHVLRRDVERLLTDLAGEIRVVVEIDESPGPQGASGSAVRYLSVTSRSIKSQLFVSQVVVKDCGQLERQALALLSMQKQCVFPMAFAKSEKNRTGAICMPFGDAWGDAEVEPLARSLAAMHYTNLGKPRAWMPALTDDLPVKLGLDWIGRWHEAWKDGEFSAGLKAHTPWVEQSLEALVTNLCEMAADASANTLVNAHLVPGQVRDWQGSPVVIGWSNCVFGPLYLDLPGPFTLEQAETYREALSKLGHEIPRGEFDERYRAVELYPMLREIGVLLRGDSGTTETTRAARNSAIDTLVRGARER